MPMFVPRPGWFSQRQQCWSPRGFSSCTSRGDAFTVQAARRSPFTGHVTAVHLDVCLSPGRRVHTDVEPVAATRGSRRLLCFGGSFAVVFFRLSRYSEHRNLIPGNLGYWKQVKSSQPYRLCIFFSSPSKENVIFTVQHTNSLLAKKTMLLFFFLMPEI